MNRLITLALTLLAAAASLFAAGQKPSEQIRATHDERVELMSILCHLAGYREYNMNTGGQYIADIDSFFRDAKTHPAVRMLDSLRQTNGIGYDAPMSLAVNLQKEGSRYTLACDTATLEERWKGVDMELLTRRMSDFSADARFAEFYEAHQPFYDSACELFNAEVTSLFRQGWYEQFYGTKATEHFEIIIGFANGGGNYGPHRQLPGKPKDVYSIIGYSVDDSGQPLYRTYAAEYLNTLIHEFNHSFVNPLAADPRFAGRMKAAGEKLQALSRQTMRKNAYTSWETIVNESIVRAAVVRYFIDNGMMHDEIRQSLIGEVATGFCWMPGLVKCLTVYSSHRDQYPTLDTYYDCLIQFFDDFAAGQFAEIDSAIQ